MAPPDRLPSSRAPYQIVRDCKRGMHQQHLGNYSLLCLQAPKKGKKGKKKSPAELEAERLALEEQMRLEEEGESDPICNVAVVLFIWQSYDPSPPARDH